MGVAAGIIYDKIVTLIIFNKIINSLNLVSMPIMFFVPIISCDVENIFRFIYFID